jgi:PAS domain S-box-containing protein
MSLPVLDLREHVGGFLSPEGILREIADAYNNRDLTAIERLWAENAVLVPWTSWAPPGTAYRGRTAIVSHTHEVFGRLPHLRFEPVWAREVAGYLLVSWRIECGSSAATAEMSERTALYEFELGRIVHAECFTTEDEAVEAASRPSVHEGHMLFNAAPSPILVLDDQGRLLDANAAACELFGLTVGELDGRTLHDFSPPELKHAQGLLWARLHEEGRLDAEFILVGANGVWRRMALHARADCRVRHMHLAVLTPLGNALDRPARRQAEQLRLSTREREVLTRVAHGEKGDEIAEQLVLSPETVRTHIQNAVGKLDARNRAHAIAIAIADGEIELELQALVENA